MSDVENGRNPHKRGASAVVEDLWFREDGTPKTRNGKGLQWKARYVTDAGVERAKSFRTKREAKAFLQDTSAAVVTGSYVDPTRSSVTVAEVAAKWEKTLATRTAGTRENYTGVLRRYVLPRWGTISVGDVSQAEVEEWLGDLTKSGSASGGGLSMQTVKHAHRVLSMVLGHAVSGGSLRNNPARSLNRGILGPKPIAAHRFLTMPEVKRLGAAVDYLSGQRAARHRIGKRLRPLQVEKDADGVAIIPEAPASQDGTMVRFMAATGMRWGEVAGLRVRSVDLSTRSVAVVTSASEVGGKIVEGPPKSGRGRHVTFPSFLVVEMVALLEGKGKADLVFPSSEGTPLRNTNFRRRAFDPAVKLAGLEPLRIHDLRHTFASVSVAQGADVKVLQAALGHASATLTLDTYSSLLASKAADVAAGMDRAWQA